MQLVYAFYDLRLLCISLRLLCIRLRLLCLRLNPPKYLPITSFCCIFLSVVGDIGRNGNCDDTACDCAADTCATGALN
jgi:hypothetical protein